MFEGIAAWHGELVVETQPAEVTGMLAYGDLLLGDWQGERSASGLSGGCAGGTRGCLGVI